MGQITRYLAYSGSYPAARDLCKLMAGAYRDSDAYGPEHPETLAASYELARWTGQAGDAAGARDQLAILLPIRERVRGPDHPDTLMTRDQLTYWAGQAEEGLMSPG